MGGILSILFSSHESKVPGDFSSESSLVVKFDSADNWQRHLDSVKETNQLMVVDFTADWCSACMKIEPAVNAMASKFTDVRFAKIDVDDLRDVANEWGVQQMPTFVLMKGGKEVDRIVGAKKDQLEKKIKKHIS